MQYILYVQAGEGTQGKRSHRPAPERSRTVKGMKLDYQARAKVHTEEVRLRLTEHLRDT